MTSRIIAMSAPSHLQILVVSVFRESMPVPPTMLRIRVGNVFPGSPLSATIEKRLDQDIPALKYGGYNAV